MTSAKPALVCLMGPTASGKTELAIALAAELDCELVSVDSALVYRGLDIGSAKPDYPHHLVDICDPTEAYSAARFSEDARIRVAEIVARGRTPLLVGGTMLYFKAFLEGLADMPEADPVIRAQIEREAAAQGWPHMHRQLAAVDPAAAARIHPRHSQRLSRALEVYRATGTTLSAFHAQGSQGGGGAIRELYRVIQLAICPADRAQLHRRIEQRFSLMLDAGLVQEVRQLQARGDLHPDLPAVRAVGYRQVWQYLDGLCTLEEARDRAVAATRQLAKRQLTWLRKWPEIEWILTDHAGNVAQSDQFVSGDAGVPCTPLAHALQAIGDVRA
ncbi:tRNA (adenosine(37)-N6)-dimethylallyltransferase MiaA [Candidatus Marimicrobium litorale]|jgi:tRNA dimethylallyltransferase|uniref:tRNA dimethylallyltransferase n=1 Tax=Candidatus Marimicrobium litorale TaxID=2518991 RepID=A0ABT3T9L7_9GAMM|nr:tRNA (adenosine(37)-N6)-dimethylallyltransferase MiaA [Candidatus Marimicrobium litorale]MCX2978978.1 tRNA (adenosine(37)-N6)-dimethylallyltransferase MiaA [Candidatus Marimicrobium litorale]